MGLSEFFESLSPLPEFAMEDPIEAGALVEVELALKRPICCSFTATYLCCSRTSEVLA